MEVQGKKRTSDQVANATFETSVKDVKAFRKEIDDNVDKMEEYKNLSPVTDADGIFWP